MRHSSCHRPPPAWGSPGACPSWTLHVGSCGTQGPAATLPSEVLAPPRRRARGQESPGCRTRKAPVGEEQTPLPPQEPEALGIGEQHWFSPHIYTSSENTSTHLARLASRLPLLLPTRKRSWWLGINAPPPSVSVPGRHSPTGQLRPATAVASTSGRSRGGPKRPGSSPGQGQSAQR